MSLPAKVEIAFTGTIASPVWTDVSGYAMSATITRGRQYNTGQFSAGQAQVVFDNTDNRFTPGLSSGAYYPNIVPRRPVRISCVNGTTNVVFRGLTERFTANVSNNTFDQTTLTAVDYTKYLDGVIINYAAVVQEMLADAPLALYRLSETSGSQVGNISATQQANATIYTGDTLSGGTLIESVTNTDALGATVGIAGYSGTGLNMTTSLTGSGTLSTNNIGPSFVMPSGAMPTSGGFTFEMWAKVSTLTAATSVDLFKATDSAGDVFEFNVSTVGTQVIMTPNSGSTVQSLYATRTDDGQFHHYAFTLDSTGKVVQAFIDGVAQTASSASTAAASQSGLAGFSRVGLARFGQSSGSGSSTNTCNVTMALVATYTGVLSGTRIAAHYTAGTTGFAGESEVARANRILGYAGNPSGITTSFSSTTDSVLGPCDWADGSANSLMTLLNNLSNDSGALIFFDRQGNLVLQDRNQRARTTSSSITFRDSTGTAVQPFAADINDTRIVNFATVNLAHVAGTYTAQDSTSISNYGERTVNETINVVDGAEAQARAQWDVFLNKTPTVNIEQVTLDASTMTTTTGIDTLDISTRITIADLPSRAPSSAADYFIEQVQHTVTPQDGWTVGLVLSPAALLDVWVLEDPTYGIIDSTHVIAY